MVFKFKSLTYKMSETKSRKLVSFLFSLMTITNLSDTTELIKLGEESLYMLQITSM